MMSHNYALRFGYRSNGSNMSRQARKRLNDSALLRAA
jgi:hypothetical protein